jgi:hypothetical protein
LSNAKAGLLDRAERLMIRIRGLIEITIFQSLHVLLLLRDLETILEGNRKKWISGPNLQNHCQTNFFAVASKKLQFCFGEDDY